MDDGFAVGCWFSLNGWMSCKQALLFNANLYGSMGVLYILHARILEGGLLTVTAVNIFECLHFNYRN